MNRCLRTWAVLAALGAPASAVALNPVSWTYQQTIRRADTRVTWTSPTAIELGLAAYRWDYEITQATATAGFLPVNILPELGDLRTGAGVTRDLPAVLLSESLVEPTTGTRADLLIEVDAAGFGQAVASNIALGTVNVLGFPVTISRIDLTATIRVEGFAQGDFNLDRAINAGDYTAWVAAYGLGAPSVADANRDGRVNAADFTVWRDLLPEGATAVPEPTTLPLMGMAFLRARRGRRRG
ncbi:MAG: hypothetical protein ACRCT8_16200 [Lacipirellulaceae bacterium]